jgi:hypothetical protein
MTTSMPSAAAWAPSSRAWPRCAVSTTSSLSSPARAPTSTSRIPGVVLVAAGLTTTSARMTASLGMWRAIYLQDRFGAGRSATGRPA